MFTVGRVTGGWTVSLIKSAQKGKERKIGKRLVQDPAVGFLQSKEEKDILINEKEEEEGKHCPKLEKGRMATGAHRR